MAITDRLIDKMIKNNIIKKEDEEIYQFGLEGLNLKILHYSTYLFIAISLKEVLDFIIFFVAFFALRRNAGGYHAKTKKSCYWQSCLTILGVILLIKLLYDMKSITKVCIALLLVAADVLICSLAPLGNRNRNLEDDEKEYFKKRTLIVLFLENIIILFLAWKEQENYSVPVMLAILCQAAILLIERKRKDKM